jgi:hypothetical protein
MLYRKVIACKYAHGFVGNEAPPQLLQGNEVLMASGNTVEDAADLLESMANQYGWTRDRDGEWECGIHHMDAAGKEFVVSAQMLVV